MSYPIVKFVEYEKNDLKGFTLIEGFPGLGLVGTICAKYLTEKIKFEEIGHIESEIFMPMIRVEKGIPQHPARIYASSEKKLAILLSEQIIPRNNTYHFAKYIAEWVRGKKIRRVISLEGIHSDGTVKEDIVYAVAANEKTREVVKKIGLSLVENGLTTGVTSMLMLEFKRDYGIEAYSILADVKNVADYKGAAELMKKLGKILNFGINIEPLIEEARKTEKALLKQLEELKTAGEAIDKFETKTPMYT